MKKKVCVSLVLVGFMLFISNCATIFKGDHRDVKIHSEPRGAEVYINGEYYGRTPLRLHLKSSQSYVIEYRMMGFRPVTRHINNKIGAGWVILDVVAGLVPVVVDALTGAWYDLDQKYVNVILERQQPRP
jgi:hypothetical protein